MCGDKGHLFNFANLRTDLNCPITARLIHKHKTLVSQRFVSFLKYFKHVSEEWKEEKVTYSSWQPGCQGHFQISFETKKCRNQDKDFSNILEHIPVLYKGYSGKHSIEKFSLDHPQSIQKIL